MTYTVTPWINGTQKPLPDRPGLYQRKVSGKRTRNRGIAWARWDGSEWRLFSYSPIEAMNKLVRSYCQNGYPWRGVVFDDRMSRTRPETLGDW